MISSTFLGWLDIAAAALVAVGCVGELTLVLRRKPDKEETPEVKAHNHFLEMLFVFMVAIGVTTELIALPFSLKEAAQLNERASRNELQVAVLTNQTSMLVSSNLAVALLVEQLRSNNIIMEDTLGIANIHLLDQSNQLLLAWQQLAIADPKRERLGSVTARASFAVDMGTNVIATAPTNDAFANLLISPQIGSIEYSLDLVGAECKLSRHGTTNTYTMSFVTELRDDRLDGGAALMSHFLTFVADYNRLFLTVPFLPTNTMVLSGDVKVVLNDRYYIAYDIAAQSVGAGHTLTNHFYWPFVPWKNPGG